MIYQAFLQPPSVIKMLCAFLRPNCRINILRFHIRENFEFQIRIPITYIERFEMSWKFYYTIVGFNITFFVCVGFQRRIPSYLIPGLFTYCTAIQETPTDLSTLNHYLFSVIKFSTASDDHSKQTSCKFFAKFIFAVAECNFYDSRSYAVSILLFLMLALRE